MLKVLPSNVPPVLISGNKAHKPEIVEAVIMQASIIKNLLPEKLNKIPFDKLYAYAEKKKAEAEEIQHIETCVYLEDVFSRPEEW